jgi:catechol 2,3-dioxygenase-like lactoylglutathione lyase family enzyme
MLRDHAAMATVAVSDLGRAREFYGERLGLASAGDTPPEMGVALFRAGGSTLVVYRSEYAGSNKATSVTWGVGDDFDAIVAALRKAGVPFEHYDIGMKREGDVHRAGDFKAAWFRDPDGNILHLNNE